VETETKQRTQLGEWGRSILARYKDVGYFGYRFCGPHFVVYEEGEFYLRPFGYATECRYSFRVRPEFLHGQEEPLWTFTVM
jgi:hypothetical protein